VKNTDTVFCRKKITEMSPPGIQSDRVLRMKNEVSHPGFPVYQRNPGPNNRAQKYKGFCQKVLDRICGCSRVQELP